MAKIKVSQKTIDNIKTMGMTKTLQSLKSIGQPGSRNVPASKEFIEGARRMYGSRVDKYLPAKSTSADAARRSASGAKTATKATIKAVSTKGKPMAKSSSAATKAKVIGGTLLAIGLAAKGGPAGRKAATKFAPGLAKSAVGKALFGTTPKVSPAAMARFKAAQAAKAAPAKVTVGPKGSFGPTTKTMAKSKLGTPSEYASKAGQASARAGIKTPTADAARAAASKVTKKKAAGASLASNKRK